MVKGVRGMRAPFNALLTCKVMAAETIIAEGLFKVKFLLTFEGFGLKGIFKGRKGRFCLMVVLGIDRRLL